MASWGNVYCWQAVRKKAGSYCKLWRAPGSWECCKLCHSGGETRRALGEGEWSLLIINTPLGDESGLELAMEAAGRTMAAVLLLVKAELADAVAAGWRKAALWWCPSRYPGCCLTRRFALHGSAQPPDRLRRENMRLGEKAGRNASGGRAKCALIQYRGMTEQQAHRYLEKKAMDTRKPGARWPWRFWPATSHKSVFFLSFISAMVDIHAGSGLNCSL